MLLKRLSSLLLFAVISFSANASVSDCCGYPSASRIASDLVGVHFSESAQDGFFSNEEWYFAPDERLTVYINDYYGNAYNTTFEVTIELLTPTRGVFDITGHVVYFNGDYGWEFDAFYCDRIMPEITNSYFNYVSIEHKGLYGERYLELRNRTNVKLGVYVDVTVCPSGKVTRGRIHLDPNEVKKVGGLFIGDVESYSLYYIERE